MHYDALGVILRKVPRALAHNVFAFIIVERSMCAWATAYADARLQSECSIGGAFGCKDGLNVVIIPDFEARWAQQARNNM